MISDAIREFKKLNPDEQFEIFQTLLKDKTLSGTSVLSWYLLYLEDLRSELINYISTLYSAALDTLPLDGDNLADEHTKALVQVLRLTYLYFRPDPKSRMSIQEKKLFDAIKDCKVAPLAQRLAQEQQSF